MSGAPAHDPEPPTRWTPPEQHDGARWDNAANRWVLGLVAYRLIAGALPFGGAGLRADMRERASGAVLFPEEIARALEPGVQSFVLAMLAARASERPASAAAIVARADALLSGLRAPRRPARAKARETASRPPSAISVGRARASSSTPRARSRRRAARS